MSATTSPNHRSVINDDEIEWLQDLPGSIAPLMASELAEAEEFYDEDVKSFCHKLIRGWASINGKRVLMVAEIAKNEEAAQTVAELTVGRRGV